MVFSFDTVFVGAGPASLAGAIHLKRLARQNPKIGDIRIAVIEKAPGLGDQSLSGATFDTRALSELIPNMRELGVPLGPVITRERLYFLTRKHGLRSPIIPPPMSNRGKHMVSLSDLVRWMGRIAESEGIEIYTGEAADELIMDGTRVVGLCIKGKGLDREGKPKTNFVPATDVAAKVVVLGEGSRGHLTKRLIKRLSLDSGCTPQGYAVGLKELWQVCEEKFRPGCVINAMGYPIPLSTFGGGFIYHIKDRMIAVGLVVGLDYKNPGTHPFKMLQLLKEHPLVARTIEGARFVAYGAKTICEGGWFAMPRSYGDGFLIVGEAAGVLDAMRLKGIDPAIKSGMMAAETIAEALARGDTSAAALSGYGRRFRKSWIGRDMYRARNFHQGFHGGIIPGMIHSSLQFISGGRGIVRRFKVEADWRCMKQLAACKTKGEIEFRPNGKTTFDKLTCVFGSGTKHEEEQPCHIQIDDRSICDGRCGEEFGNPCQFFCPANVFEMVEEDDGARRLNLNPSNCLHCKTCDIKDPYAIATWAPPEGGGGPNYKGM